MLHHRLHLYTQKKIPFGTLSLRMGGVTMSGMGFVMFLQHKELLIRLARVRAQYNITGKAVMDLGSLMVRIRIVVPVYLHTKEPCTNNNQRQTDPLFAWCLQPEPVPVSATLDKQMLPETKLRCLQFCINNCDNLPEQTYLSELDGSALLFTLVPSRQCRTVLWFTAREATMKTLHHLHLVGEHQVKVLNAIGGSYQPETLIPNY